MARTMWAVGPDDGEGWMAINAPDEANAKAAYAAEHDCEMHYLIASRVKGWDCLEKVTGPDWLRNGHGFTCATCDQMAFAEDGGVIVNDQVFCESCSPTTPEAALTTDASALKAGGV